ncbi:hypothetical protein HID58_026537 [Brassica napus]|uniref:guanylate kinase n=1 Tax=Brassica napus TaxID=3708 RepID=A0ABQ8CPW5_BRANA|nr:hypothetical protein HID58_026537 [Brassica napus]
MGEAPAFFVDLLENGFGVKTEPENIDTSVQIGDRSYVIGRNHEGNPLFLGVQIHDKTTNKSTPTVLGTGPKPCKAYSAIVLKQGRILVIKKGSASDDSIWFLEVDSPFVREQRKLLGKEVVAWSKGVRGNAEKPIVISGPSGVGKGTLIAMLMKEFPSMFGFSVSHTTRSPRCMEENGVHYHFTDKTVMEKEINDGKFLEYASVHGNLYGTSIESVEVVTDSGKRCILDIDVQGARSVKASSLDAVFIFVCPPSMKELEDRLRARGTETEEQIQKRLRNAEAEIKAGESSGIFEHILYNDNLEECYKNLKNVLRIIDDAPVNGVQVEGINLPKEHTVTKNGDKILIQETGEATKNNMIVLDLSSINGGAPGRTRGIVLDTIGQIPHIATCGTLKVDGSLKHCNLNRFVGPKRRFDIAYKSVTLLEEKANDGVSFSTLSPPPTLVYEVNASLFLCKSLASINPSDPDPVMAGAVARILKRVGLPPLGVLDVISIGSLPVLAYIYFRQEKQFAWLDEQEKRVNATVADMRARGIIRDR